MPPTLTSKPTEALLGGSKRFKCQVIGNPRPLIRWFKDGMDITTNPRYSFDFTMEGRISMVIPSVTYKDEGCYRCRAENSEGIASTASYLMIRGSVHEHRDEIPSSDVAEMEIEEVYIKHRDEDSFSEEMSKSSKKRTEKKDRWKSSEVEVTEEFSSSQSSTTIQKGVTFESSQSKSITEESKQWQIESESNMSTKNESESGFTFDGQSLVIESQVFGKTQEMLAELDSDPSIKIKPIFVDNRKRPSDELEAEDVIELVIREEEKSESLKSSEKKTSSDKNLELFIDEEDIVTKDTSVASIPGKGKLVADTTSTSSSKEHSREITAESEITQVSYSTESESSTVIKAEIETSQSTSETTMEQAGLKEKSKTEEQKSSKNIEESLMEKMKKFKDEREEEVELFISEESESTSTSSKTLSAAEKKLKAAEEQKLADAERKQQKLKAEEEKRKKQKEEEEAAMLEKIQKFKKNREKEESIDLFSGELEVTVESSQGQEVVIEEASAQGASKTEGKQFEMEDFYSKETTVEGDIEVSREERKVFSFESEVSSQSFQEVTTEDESSAILVQSTVDGRALGSNDTELTIGMDVAIEDIAVHEEEERLNAKNKKLSALEQARQVEAETQLKISGDVTVETSAKDSETVIETVISEEVVSSTESRRGAQAEPTTDSSKAAVSSVSVEAAAVSASQADLSQDGMVLTTKISTDEKGIDGNMISVTSETEISETVEKGFKISAEIETEEKQFRDDKNEQVHLKKSSDVDGVAYGEKAELFTSAEESSELNIKRLEEASGKLTDGSSVTDKVTVEESHFNSKEATTKTSIETSSALSETENAQKSKQKDIDDGAKKAKIRPKLTAEASVGEDETDLESVVDVKETQTEKADLHDTETERFSFGIQAGVESQAQEDALVGDSIVSIVIQDQETASGTEALNFQSQSAEKGSQGELKSDVLLSETQAEGVSDLSEARADGDVAVTKDVAGVAEGIKEGQEEYRSALQEGKVTSETTTGVDEEKALLADQSETKLESNKASKTRTEYQVESEESTSEKVSVFGEESKAESKISEDTETEMLLASIKGKASTQASSETADVDLHITEDLKHSDKVSADVDGIAEGEKRKAMVVSGAEAKVAESLFDTEEGKTKGLSEHEMKALEAETVAQEQAKKDSVQSQVAEQTSDQLAESLDNRTAATTEKALEVSAEVSVEAKTKETEESKVDVLSSVDSVKYSSTVEETSSIDVSVVEETSVTESAEKLVVTSETSTVSSSEETPQISTETFVSETKKSDEEQSLEIQVDVSTESKSTEQEAKALEEKLTISAEIETEQKSKQAELSVTADEATTEAKGDLSVSVSVDSEEKNVPKDTESTDGLTFSASVETTDKSSDSTGLVASIEVQETTHEKELPSVSVEVEEVTADVSLQQELETKEDTVSAEIEIPAEEVKPVPSAPEIDGPADITVEVGQTINIEVTISGIPEPKVSWTKDFGRVEESKNIKMSVNASVYCLQVLNSVKKDAGKYRVTASNSEGRATFDIKVKVTPAKEATPKKDEVKKSEKAPPKIVAPADVSVEVGQALNVEINVTGNPAPRVSWYKDGKPVYPNYRTKINISGDVYSLQILNTVEADAGCYRAIAVNQKGEESCDVAVTVTLPAPPQEISKGEDTETSVTIETEPEVVVEEPVAEKEIEPSVPADVKISADTKTAEDQKPEITAEVEVKETEPAKEKDLPEDVSLKVSLSQEPETKSDEVSAEIEIPVEEVKPVPSAPEIDGPADITVEAGQTINIEVTISGFPEPKVSWTKDFGRVEESKKIKMSVNANVYCLQVLNTVKVDAGKYRVTASNSEGRTTFDVKVKVTPAKEAAPKKDEVKSGKSEKVSPQIVAPADVTVQVGQTLNVEITVTGNPPPRVTWYKDGKPVYPNYKTKTNISGDVYSLQILNTVEADAGCYRATAVNQKGEESCNVMVTVTLPAPPQETSTGEDTETSVTLREMEPPELSTKPEDKSVTEGEPVTLAATVKGRPLPTVTWFKNDILLRTGYNCRLYKQGRSHFVEIQSAEIFDAGNYSMCVENPAGAVFWSIRIDVEAATEQESSGSTVGDDTVFTKDKPLEETPDEIFLKEYVMLSDFKDDSTDFGLREKETVEILDTVNTNKWLVRKQDDKEKVCYVPIELMRCKSDSSDVPLKARKRSISRKMSEDAGASSGEEDTMKARELFPLYVAVADYTPPEGDTLSLKISEGQFVEVLDMDNTEKWLVRTKPTKSTPVKQGWVLSCYLEEKNLKARSSRESFREDIIKIKNPQQEALVKRRYVLTDLLEKEREYVNQLKKMTECFYDNMYKERNIPALLKDKKDIIFANIKEIQEFHAKVLLPALTACTMSPASVGKIFLNKKDDFMKYIPYGCGRDNAEDILSADEVKTFLQDYNRKSGCEQVLPECLRRPVKRLHEYQAVLKDILKFTIRAGEDCTEIEAAIHMLAEILRRMDDLHLLSKVESFPGDIAALGPLLRHDDLQLWEDEPEGKGKDRHVFLFPDKVLITKQKKDGTGYVHKSTSELQDIQINETVLSDNRQFELWYAEPTSEKLTLQARNDISKQAWSKDVRDALKKIGVEETDISLEQQQRSKKKVTFKSPSPAPKPTDKTSPAKELNKGDTAEEDYVSFDSLDSDVSSYHTATEFDDGSTLPFFKKRLRKTVVKEGDRVRLECTVAGRPLPTVNWQKGVYPIRNSEDLRVETEGAYNSLTIPDAIPADSGVYTAKASNINGSAVCSTEVKVGDQSTDQEYITAQSALSSDGELTLPAKMGQMDSCVVEEGRMARFDCNLVADPKPEIIWLKDGKILTSSKKYEVLNPRDDLHSLIVHDVHKDDSGRYVCWARNEFGEAFTEAYLNIIPTKEAEIEVERIAPKIIKKFYDVVAVNGKDAEVKFKFIGSPAPHIQWYVKNKEILPPREYDINVEGDQCSFTLKEVSMADAGKIIVKLTNPVGEASCSSQLTIVEDFSKPKTLPKVAPKFITRFTDVDVNEGFEARFKAKVTGEPIPTVTWLRNGLPVKDCSRYKYEQYGEIFVFIIENAESGDAGEYTCQATNKAGDASCKASLAVTKVKIPLVSDHEGGGYKSSDHEGGGYKSSDYGRKSYTGLSSKKDLKGAHGEMGPQFGYAPVFTKMIQDCDSKEGRWAEFQCRAYGMPEPTACWTHNGVPLERGPRFIMSKDEESNYHLMIKDVLPSDAGQYSCKLSNFAGKASCSAELRVEALPRRDLLRLSPERGVDEEVKVQKKVIMEPPSMPDQKPVLLDKTPDSVRISWLPAHVPIKSPSANPTMYIVESRELPSGDWRRMASMISDKMYQAKGLNPNAEYLFRVRAENDNGMSAPTQPACLEMRASKAKKAEKDAKLEGLLKGKTDTMGLSVDTAAGFRFLTDKPTLLDIRPESVRIQWVPVTVPGPGSDYRPVKYLLEMKEIPGPWRKLEGGLTGNSYFATDLNPDREYNFRVSAENKFGQSEPTLPATLPRGRVVPPALKPYKPYASDFGAESLRLSWQPADVSKELKGVSPTSYKIEVQELPKQDWQTLVSYIPDTSYRLTDLRPEQDYNFRIRAENEFGLSEPSRPFYLQNATTYPGTAVTRPDIVELEPSAVRLNWQRVNIPKFELDEEPLTYMIEGRSPASDWRELVRGVRGTSHYLSGLDLEDDYSFRVRPDLGSRGLGDPSPPMALSRALARTRIPVSDLEIEELEPTSARLRWDRVHIPPFDSMEEPLLYMIECQEGPYASWRTLATGVPTTSFRVSDLKPEKDYAFRVRAETEYGISEPSPPKPLYRKPLEAPRYHLEMPKLERFDADSLQLSWKPISPHPQIRRADPPKYTIEMQEAPQADWRPVAAGIPDTSFRLAGLQPEQDYSFRVRAEMSRFPDPVALLTPSVSLLRGGAPPVMPSSAPTISNEKPNSLRLSWRPANLPSYLVGDIGPIRYRVEAQEGASSEWRTLVSRLAEPFYEVTKLHPQREYSFRVRAETESGTSGPTAPAYLYRKPVPHLPKSEPLLSDIRPDSVRLTWQAVDVPGRAIDFQKVNYLIEMQEPPSQSWLPFVRDVHEINHRIQNLRPDKDYIFRVRAVTDQGMSEPTQSVYLPRRAVQPRLPLSEPYISDVKPESARLSWSPVDTPPFGAVMAPTTYRVEIQDTPNSNWQTLVRKLPTTNYLLTNLRPDKMYSLRVRAENDYGVSEPTRAIQLPKRAVAPIVPRDIPMVADVRGGSMRLTWQPAHVPSYGGSTVQLPVTYTIEGREPGRDWAPLVRRIPHTSYFLSGLRPEGDYEFRVRAESQYGLSPPGPSTSLPRHQVARIPIHTPRIVDIQPDGRSLELQWQRASGTGTELITYVIEAQEPPSMDWSSVARGVMDTKYRVTGLRPNQDYLFRVRAQTAQGLSEPTLPVTFYRRLISPRVPVERPQLYDLEPEAVRLSWQPTSTYRSETPLRYTVEVREPQIKKWRPLVKNLPDTSYHVTGLKPKLDYEFRVRPETDKGLLEPTPSIPLYRRRVLPALKFEEPRILDDEPDSVALRWQRVHVPRYDAGDEELTYMIEAQRGSTLDWQPIARNIRDSSYRVTGLGPYDDYQFRIRGESRDFGYTEPSLPMPLYRKPSKGRESSSLVFMIDDPVVKYPYSSDSKLSRDINKPPRIPFDKTFHPSLSTSSPKSSPQLPRRSRASVAMERRPSIDLGYLGRTEKRPALNRLQSLESFSPKPSPQLPRRRESVAMERRPSLDLGYLGRTEKRPALNRLQPLESFSPKSSPQLPRRREPVAMERRPSFDLGQSERRPPFDRLQSVDSFVPKSSPQLPRRSRFDLPRRGSVTMERRPSFDLGQTDRRPALDRLQSFEGRSSEKYSSREKITSFNQQPILEHQPSVDCLTSLNRQESIERIDRMFSLDRRPSVERMTSVGRIASLGRRPSIELDSPSLRRKTNLQKWSSVDRLSGLDRRTSLDRSYSTERLGTFDRWSSLDKLPDLPKVSASPKPGHRARRFSISGIPSHEKFSSAGVLHDRDALLARGVEADRRTSADRSTSKHNTSRRSSVHNVFMSLARRPSVDLQQQRPLGSSLSGSKSNLSDSRMSLGNLNIQPSPSMTPPNAPKLKRRNSTTLNQNSTTFSSTSYLVM